MPRPPRSSRSSHTGLPTVEEVSAGGLVVDLQHRPLRGAVIGRLNRAGRLEWCLPKGHPEAEETLPQTAVREIAEETGITGQVIGPLGSIDYWFSTEDRRVHKMVHHFLLEAVGGELTVDGDPDAEAVEAAWVTFADLGRLLAFPNERRIAREAFALLADHT